jgi:hypothetical protein
VPECRSAGAGVPECRSAGVPVCRCAGVPVCRSWQKFWDTGPPFGTGPHRKGHLVDPKKPELLIYMRRSEIYALIHEAIELMQLSTSSLDLQIWVRGPGPLDFEEYTIDRRPFENVFDIVDSSAIGVAIGGVYEIMQDLRRLTQGLEIDAVILGDHSDGGVGTMLYNSDRQEFVPLSRRRSSNDRPTNDFNLPRIPLS